MREPGGEPALEDLLARLEDTVRRLVDGRAPLERLVEDWERANQLVAAAEQHLERAAARIAELRADLRGDLGGDPVRDRRRGE